MSYATANGTAEEPTDYTAKNGTLTFSAEQSTRQTISVRTLTDSTVEDNETFTVTLSSPTDEATIQRSVATGTITDDDLPALSIAKRDGGRGRTRRDFVVTLRPGERADRDGALRDNERIGRMEPTDYTAAKRHSHILSRQSTRPDHPGDADPDAADSDGTATGTRMRHSR